MRRIITLITLLLLSVHSVLAQETEQDGDQFLYNRSIWTHPDRGFYWSPDPKDSKEEAKAKPEKTYPPIQSLKSVEEVKAELNRLRDLAIMTPSETNVKAFLEANKYWMDMSERFADKATVMAWQTPNLDQNTKRPFANSALVNLSTREYRSQEDLAKTLSQDYGIVFFYRSDCSFCHEQAPILKQLEQRYGMSILPVSLDGGGINEFDNAVPDNGFSYKLTQGQGISVTPSLFMISKDKQHVTFLGAGLVALDELLKRMKTVQQEGSQQ